MAEAAIKARQFGLNLEQAEKISSSLLQFESSIENELSAELLTGKDLNFERARGLALNGDTAAAAAEIAKQVGTAADFGNMNVIQQEAIAKAAGMERDELAQSLIDRESLAKLGAKEGQSAQDRYNELKAQGMSEAAIAQKLGSEKNAQMYEQQGLQEKFNQTVEKLQEIFMTVANALMPVFDILSSVMTDILPGIATVIQTVLKPIEWLADLIGLIGDGFTWVGEKIGALIGPLGMVGKILKGVASIAIVFAAYEAFASLAAIPVVGFGLGIAAAAAITTAGFGLLSGIKANDMVSPGQGGGGYGSRTLLGPEGAIQLNNKDTVIAGTNLFDKGDDVMSGPKGALSVSNRTAPKKEVTQDPNSGINARLDRLISTTGKVNAIPTLRIQ